MVNKVEKKEIQSGFPTFRSSVTHDLNHNLWLEV